MAITTHDTSALADVSGPRALRADAQRNRQRLIEAAHAAFQQHGADASLDDIARVAGVGSGTLYRHFPTRQALLAAVSEDAIAALLVHGKQLCEAPDAGAAMHEWFSALVVHITTFDGFADELRKGMEDEHSELHGACMAMGASFDILLRRAQEAGAVRSDVEPTDVRRLVHAVAHATEGLPDRAQAADRLLRMLLDGLRSR
ncbi:MAG: transcriptional regulator TetR family [Solirubrobacterales bacterium]|nr:transcriptional regulator TetR family [Solirubrobacterales bacterium]